MKTAVVIPLHNGAAEIAACLQALAAQQVAPFLTIVVDNGSSDQGAQIITRDFPQVELLQFAEPLGFAGACNRGIEAALAHGAELLALLNQDTEVDPGWLAALTRALQADERIGVIGSLARFADGAIQHAGAELTKPLGYGRNLLSGALELPPEPLAYDYLAFMAVGLRAAMLREIGLLDEGFYPAYFEDADLCLRAVAAGWRLHLALDATLIHHEGAAGNASYRHTAMLERHRLRLALKHRALDDLLSGFFQAEQAQMLRRALEGSAQVLRQAYGRALIEWPNIARQRELSAQEHDQVTEMLAMLRDEAGRRERTSRMMGLGGVEWGMGNEEWRMRNGELRTQNPEEETLPSRKAYSMRPPQLPDGERKADSMRLPQPPPAPETPGAYFGQLHEADTQPSRKADSMRPPQPPAAPETPGACFGQVNEEEKRRREEQENLQPSTSLPPITIIILTWNGLEYTQRCIKSIRAHISGIDYRLLAVDNGSSDGSLEWLRAQADITLIANERNLGFTRGNNQGMSATPPDHDVLLLNNDTVIIQDHWLAHLREVAHSRADIGIVGCTLLHTNGLLQHAGTYMPTDSFWGYQIGGGETFIGQYPGVREVEGITGACMYIRHDLRAAIGGLDEAYVSYFEDTDYCLRAQQAGFRVVCTGGTQVIHHENTSSRVNNAAWQAMWDRGRAIFVARWSSHFQQKYSRGLVWHSLISGPSGYATSSRELAVELDRRGIDVRLACIWGNDFTEPPTGDPRLDQLRPRPKDVTLPQVVYHQGDSFIKNSGRPRIGYTMLEADGLPEEWVNQANQMDEIWTPTRWGADVFRASGVRRPIHVVPLGINPDYFHPAIQGRKPANRFVFLSVFDWIERKAPELLLQAYQRAFRRNDDVVLLLKIFNNDRHFDLARRIAELTSSDGPPVVVLPNQQLAAHQLGALYRSADCFVLPTRGEGWGMPTLEAMACGLPVISTAWGAQTEFLHSGVAYPLRIRGLVPAEARAPYYHGLRWADPDSEHLATLMRHVYEHPEEARATGMRAAAEAASRWTWSRAADVIISRLEALD